MNEVLSINLNGIVNVAPFGEKQCQWCETSCTFMMLIYLKTTSRDYYTGMKANIVDLID